MKIKMNETPPLALFMSLERRGMKSFWGDYPFLHFPPLHHFTPLPSLQTCEQSLQEPELISSKSMSLTSFYNHHH